MRRIRIAVAGAAMICAAAILPSVASADCTLTSQYNGNDVSTLTGGTTQTFSGHFDPDLNGKFIQIPFEVGSGMTGMKIRYCFAKSNAADDSPTLDLGVYGAKPTGQTGWTQAQRRGWSGSAVRTIGIGENGYTSDTVYNENSPSERKYYTPGYTTRAYKPGPIEAGEWAVELGAGWIDPGGSGVDWKVEVKTSTDPAWKSENSGQGFIADPYTPYVANPNAGWYTGDMHVHGEMEPGNATMKQTMDLGFGDLPTGNGLDFMTLVDHNNENSRNLLGKSTYSYPGKLVIPGIEVTTYNGHWNATGSSNFADFRFSPVYWWDDGSGGPDDDQETADELKLVRGAIEPASQMQPIIDGGGFTQVNHPETLKNAPASCRGCAWTYTDEQTDWSKVNALEIQNGAAGIPFANPTGMNTFTVASISTYERLLADGFHIAAVGSSDDHQAGESTGIFDGQVGRGATVVHATQLSTQGIVDAVKAGHTYVKPFGADAPDVDFSATTPEGGSGIPGDSLTGSGLNVSINVKGAMSSVRPGTYTLKLLQDGIEIDSAQVTSDDFDFSKTVTESGRYSFELTRAQDAATMIEGYSTPVWFTFKAAAKPSNAFSFGAYKANRKKGTATLKVKVKSPGKVTLTGSGLNKATAKVKKKNQTVTLNLRPKSSLKKKLKKKGSAKVKVKVT
ncbi:MAG TPA: CehA/McbA family metallohydrolase, partial [Solirubrobacterales bacterium]|nr:CehA/McbA family metallohydrolase [Solirubrobacterales bacterium]